MRILYAMNEGPGAAADVGCEKVFIDTDKTDRQELHYLIEKGGIKAGDVLCIRQVSDLGRGKHGVRVSEQIEAMGVKIELHPVKKKRDRRGRPSDVTVTDDQRKQMAIVWHEGIYGLSRTLERLSEISGQPITKSKAYTLFGNRGDKPKGLKRKAVV